LLLLRRHYRLRAAAGPICVPDSASRCCHCCCCCRCCCCCWCCCCAGAAPLQI